MRADYLTFRRATNLSLLGMVIQLVIAILLLVFSSLTGNHAALTASLSIALGVPMWLALAIVYDQHRRERIEAIEAEALAGAQQSSAFEGTGEEFKVAARRLNMMYRFFLPITSVLIAGGYIGLGIWRWQSGWPLVSQPVAESASRGWLIAIGVGIAFTGFALARYAAGMAKQKVWANLKAGGAAMVGSAFIGLALAVAHTVDHVGPDILVRWLYAVLPAFMILIGAEILLNFVLDLYRPRKAGETPRPAFDSRLLGFAAAPDKIAQSISDAINYQFGYDVASTWFYQLLSRSLGLLLGLGAAVIWGLTSLVMIEPHQKALVLRFGGVIREIGPGLHFKAPWPIDSVQIPAFTERTSDGKTTITGYSATGVRELHVSTLPPATADNGPILWTNDHGRTEEFQLVQPSRSGTADATGGSRDFALISMEIPVRYAVADVRTFEDFAPADQRDDILKAAAQREIMGHLAPLSIDDILGPKRAVLAQELRVRIEEAFARLNPGPDGKSRGAGVHVLSVGIAGVHPPKETATSFERVVQQEALSQSQVDTAKAEAIKTLTAVVGSIELAEQIAAKIDALATLKASKTDSAEIAKQSAALEFEIQTLLEKAGGKAAQQIAQARADRWKRQMGERARAEAYKGLLGTYLASPELFKASAYLDALRDAMKGQRLFIVDQDIPDLRLLIDRSDRDTTSNVFDATNRTD